MPMQDLADKISALLTIALPIVSALAGWAVGSLKKMKKKEEEKESQNIAETKAIKDGLKGLLRAKVIDLGLHYIEAGSIPPYGLETLKSCYGPYEALGDGDQSVGHIMHKCENLPVRPGSD